MMHAIDGENVDVYHVYNSNDIHLKVIIWYTGGEKFLFHKRVEILSCFIFFFFFF